MFLVTTADQRFWKMDKPVLFLGDWCKLFSQRSIWEKLSYEVLPYHWDDRKKLYRDYLYLDKLYEQTLIQMKDLLNQIHGVEHSLRYWRIVVGPWLYYFIPILYDRYQSVISAIESRKVTDTLICRYDETRWLPRDFSCFLKWFVNDDYNHYIYSRIIEFTGRMPFDIVGMEDEDNNKERTGSIKSPFAPKQILRKLITRYEKFIPDRFNQIVLISSYLNTFDLIKLQLSLEQIPYLFPPDVAIPESRVDLAAREKLSLKLSGNEFEQLVGKMIKEQIPLIYVEGYAQMNERLLKAYPKKPKVIFTAAAFFMNEAFKLWAAHHVDQGVKLVGTQHGGLYGIARWYADEAHETHIYDKYYTWGWKSDVYKNTKPFPSLRLNRLSKSVCPKENGQILSALVAFPRYFYQIYSVPVAASNGLSYFDDQMRFVRKLSEENQKLLLVRLYPIDYGWNQMERWHYKLPEINCYCGDKSMAEQLTESRLFIGTYNGTTYIETFVANFPTVLFWNPDHWELRPSAQSYYDELRNVGILHETPESAAAKVNEISHDPISWWQQPQVQQAKDKFCFQFARTSDNWLKEWKAELKQSKY